MRLGPSLIAAALFTAPAIALAEEEPTPYQECAKDPTDAEINAAKGAFQAGNASFDEADYRRAIIYWEDAYRRDCTANPLLLNLARAYELDGRKRHAVLALETFLAREPNTQQKGQILRRIDVLKKQIESEHAEPSAAPPPSAPASTSPPLVQTNPTATTDRGPGKKPILPLVVAGVGVVALGVGGTLYFLAAGDISDVEDQCFERRDCQFRPDATPHNPLKAQELSDDGNSARSRQNVGAVIAIAGAAVGVGGLVWYLVAPRKPAHASLERKASARFSPAVAPGFAGVSLTGAF